MIRILLVLLPIWLVYLLLRWFRKTPPAQIRLWFQKFGWLLAIITLLLLMASGKLNWLFAMLGLAVTFIMRLMPVILNSAPHLHRLWRLFNSGKQYQQQSSAPPRSKTMTKAEALDVLGLKPDAAEADIIQAHRKLISKLHPDRGGSNYLAAQINLAKKILIGPH